MASAQDLYKWNPLHGEYSGYTNAIRAAQTMGTAIDNLGVRLGDVGKMMADRYDRIQKENTAYNTSDALIKLAQINDPQSLQQAIQNGTLNASHWRDLYGNDFNYEKLASAVGNLSGDVLKRASDYDNLREYTPESKQKLVSGYQAINNNDPAALFKTINNGQNFSNKTIGNLASGIIKQGNDRLDYGIKKQNADTSTANAQFNWQGKVYDDAMATVKAAQEEEANALKQEQGILGLLNGFGSLAVDEQGNLQPGELSKVNASYKTAVDFGYPGSQQDFVNDVISRKLSRNSFPPSPNNVRSNLAILRAAYGNNPLFAGILSATGQAVENTSIGTVNQQPVQNGQQPQQGTRVDGVSNTANVAPQGIRANDGNGSLGRNNFNVGTGVKIGGEDPDAIFNLSVSPRTRPIPAGSFQSHVAPFVDNLANGKSYNASDKGGVDYNGEFRSYGISQGDAKQLQQSYTKTVAKASARLDEAAYAKIRSTIGLNNKGAKLLVDTLTSPKLPKKLSDEVGADTREQLIYRLQNDLNGKNLKQAEELFTQYLNPLLEHSYTSNDWYGETADVKRRALETARQTGFNPDNLANILSLVASGSLKGDELKTAVSGLSIMTPTNASYVRDMINTLRANKDYFNSIEFKTAIYSHLIQNKDYRGNPISVVYGRNDLEQQAKEKASRDKNIGKNAIKAAISTAKAKKVLEEALLKPSRF
jgi:hypothetical protein